MVDGLSCVALRHCFASDGSATVASSSFVPRFNKGSGLERTSHDLGKLISSSSGAAAGRVEHARTTAPGWACVIRGLGL